MAHGGNNARPSLTNKLFDYGGVRRGDSPNYVRGITIRCGYCDAGKQELPVNSMATGFSESDKVELNWITDKLVKMGWKVGNTRMHHRCPRCFAAAKAAALQRSQAHEIEKKGLELVMAPAPTPISKPPREMQREDRRIILAKLEEVYVDERVGYGDGWTDQRIADDLGVPRAWVATLRQENFGEEKGNDQIKELVAAADKLSASLAAADTAYRAAAKEYERLADAARRMGTDLEAVRKALTGK